MSVLWAQRREGPRTTRRLRGLATSVLGRRRPAPLPAYRTITPSANGTHHRPSPALRWTDARTTPDGDFAGSAIANASLRETDVPDRGDWDAVSEFALSYDGYAYWDDLPELANRFVQRWTRDRSLPTTLDELRGCLFYEQRRWHHFGEDPAGRSADYMQAIVDAVRALVLPTTRAPAPIPDPRAAIAPEAHVRLVSTTDDTPPTLRPVGANQPALRPVPQADPALRPVPQADPALRPVPQAEPALGPATVAARRLTPVAAAETHVKLVSSIEAGTRRGEPAHGTRAAMPAAWDRPPVASVDDGRSRHPSAYNSSAHGSLGALRPMPSAEPLPKPSVIVRRTRAASPGGPDGGTGAAISALRSSSRRWRPRDATRPVGTVEQPVAPSRDVTTFRGDDAGYRAWLDAHPAGFVLNAARPGSSRPPVLHRVTCASLRTTAGSPRSLTAKAPKVCATTTGTLEAWSAAQCAGPPAACRRCLP